MSGRPFRFLHAADFQLHQPLVGLTDFPEPLRELLIEAPYRAVERLFDVAVAEQVDCLLLSGGLLDAALAGPHGMYFLTDQFERLAARGTRIYWAATPAEAEGWPRGLALPDNAHRFVDQQPLNLILQRDGQPLASIQGAGGSPRRRLRPGLFQPDAQGAFTIALACGTAPREQLASRGIDYWALGGTSRRATLLSTPTVAHVPGTPQGRSPTDTGPSGATLVSVDSERRCRLSFVATDLVRWERICVPVTSVTTLDDLDAQMTAEVEQRRSQAPSHHLLLMWQIRGQGPLTERAGNAAARHDLLARLRGRFGHLSPRVWTVSLEIEDESPIPPAWCEEDTIRGDFLREVRQRLGAAPPSSRLDLSDCLAGHASAEVAALAALDDPEICRQALDDAVRLGVELLSPRQEHRP